MSVTVEQLTAAVTKLDEIRGKKNLLAAQLSEVQASLDQAESEALALLKEANLPNFRGPDGLISVVHRTSVKVPKEPTDRERFFQYLRERNLFDSMITVNSQTLNAFYKQELELAKERGESDFALPGISGETIVETISFRKN